MSDRHSIYGLMVEFKTQRELLAAARSASAAGYRHMDGFTPFPVEGLPEALGRKRTRLPLLVLLGGIAGGLGGYFMQWYASVIGYPLNVGGRPLNSWPMFVPITFEMTVLVAAVTAFFSTLALNKLPRLNHPAFSVPRFEHASIDRFFLCVEASDPLFNFEKTHSFLQSMHPVQISEVEK